MLTSQVFTEWAAVSAIEVRYIQPGKLDQNRFIERVNRSYQEEELNAHLLESIADVPGITGDWRRRNHKIRPHDALASQLPACYRKILFAAMTTLELFT